MATITTTVPKTTQAISATTTQTEYIFDKSQADITFANTGNYKMTITVKSTEIYTVELLPGQTRTINNQRIFSFKVVAEGTATLNMICSPWDCEPEQEGMAMSQMDDIVNKYTVAAASNIYTLDVVSRVKNFSIETADEVAKTVAFTNIPNGFVQLTIKLKYTSAATITWPGGVAWQNASTPTFVAGKTYYIQFLTDDGGTTIHASAVGAW